MIVSAISQKGGVGKSTLARLLAVEFTRAQWTVKIADLDPAQGTATRWGLRRDQRGTDPEIAVRKYRDAARAIKDAPAFDLMIMDGPAQSDRTGAVMAAASDLILIPTGYSLDDLDPQIQLAYDLEAAGVDLARVRVAFCRTRGSAKEDAAARDFIQRAGLVALDSAIRELPSIRTAHAIGRAASETGHKGIDGEGRALASEIATILTGKGA